MCVCAGWMLLLGSRSGYWPHITITVTFASAVPAALALSFMHDEKSG